MNLAVERADNWGAERMLYAALRLAAFVFPSVAPAAEAAAAALPTTTRLLLDRLVLARSSPPASHGATSALGAPAQGPARQALGGPPAAQVENSTASR